MNVRKDWDESKTWELNGGVIIYEIGLQFAAKRVLCKALLKYTSGRTAPLLLDFVHLKARRT